jgi:hypothetical protein
MNDHPPPTFEPFPKFLWLVVALSPALLIMIFIKANDGGRSSAIFVLNGLLSFVGSYGLLKKPGQHVAITLLGTATLAVFFWGFNSLVGILGGCACT